MEVPAGHDRRQTGQRPRHNSLQNRQSVTAPFSRPTPRIGCLLAPALAAGAFFCRYCRAASGSVTFFLLHRDDLAALERDTEMVDRFSPRIIEIIRVIKRRAPEMMVIAGVENRAVVAFVGFVVPDLARPRRVGPGGDAVGIAQRKLDHLPIKSEP